MNGIERIAAERKRQIEVEGYSPKHDRNYTNGELARAAHAYLVNDSFCWPWGRTTWKPASHMRNLVKAGALIAAEIDRLLALDAEGAQ